MVEIQNPQIKTELQEKTHITPVDIIPTTLSNVVVPIINVGRNIDQYVVKGSSYTSSGTFTIYTTPSDIDFYLTSVHCSFSKDATCDATDPISMTLSIYGQNPSILRLALTTITEERGSTSSDLKEPIKLDRNTTISVTGSFTAGTMMRAGTITGFTVSTLKNV